MTVTDNNNKRYNKLNNELFRRDYQIEYNVRARRATMHFLSGGNRLLGMSFGLLFPLVNMNDLDYPLQCHVVSPNVTLSALDMC